MLGVHPRPARAHPSDRRGRPDEPPSLSTRLISEDSGSSLIDFAFVLPVFFLLVFGFINFAMVLSGACNVTYASRAALRYACLHSNSSYAPAATQDLMNIIQPFFLPYPKSTHSTNVAYSNGNVVGSTVTITVSVTYQVALPGMTLANIPLYVRASGVVVQ